MNEFKNIGKSLMRVDGKEKILGKAKYPGDLYMDGMLHGVTLRSTEAHAYFSLDLGEAKKLPGVVKILTHEDISGENSHGVYFKDQKVFCKNKVRRIGDPMAFIIAENKEMAMEAKKRIKVKYEKLPTVFDPREAMKEDSPKIHGESNIIYHYKCRKGNMEEGFKKCHVIVENEFKTSMVDHAFLQIESGLAYMEDGNIVVCAATQYPHFDQVEIAEALGIPKERVRIINPAVGGAFGGREDITMQIHIALGTFLTKRPIKVTYSREESFYAHSKRHPLYMKFKTGADEKGKLIAMEANIVGDTGAYASWAVNVLRKAGVHATGPYEIPNVKIDSYAVYTNNPFCGAMRGFGATQIPIGCEQQMDILAEKLGMSPVEIRLKNCFVKNSITATGQVFTESVPIKRCIEAVGEGLNL
ncbi:MAG: molybdopterin-dependent oxidoreductase [Anaeromicrobium sp.]|jgi:CO/xanthine dehydrogenase Mo-binding subunit|uniref:xanthine dehydrogenase family protein molybdopterin-binding subunit n=1 Tax=Anaeromicrobium sp. TaxID=1929132 RepID=UPI0025DABCB7|nr:molybdopterin cofactor-binding domain-containing protein [Anaeromicrobium sp.]MCT4593542.1 molybdopterin-dependent oxidoreductase [Anaeromicrobium sp.]